MKVLFIPCSGAISHIIPLLVLYRMLSGTIAEGVFLAVGRMHPLLKKLGFNVLDIDHNGYYTGIRTEIMAYQRYKPDVVVDDASVTTGYATRLTGIPRVAIQRTGVFPGGIPRNKNHRHSLTWISGGTDHFPDTSYLGLPKPQTTLELFDANVKIVPGIRSVEVLPAPLERDPTYYFSGPLLMDDFYLQQLSHAAVNEVDINRPQNFAPLEQFFDSNQGRKIVYVTFGTVAVSTQPVIDCIYNLLNDGIAVVTSVQIGGLSEKFEGLYYFAHYLPMHFVCSNVDLVVHQCGSGTYHYPILHRVPAITIGTKCYDREDVALRLAELGASAHLPAPDECEDFVGMFKHTIDQYFHSESFRQEKLSNLERLNLEIQDTAKAFNLMDALNDAVLSAKSKLRPPRCCPA